MDGINKFVLMGKIAPNEWRPINEVMPVFEGEDFSFASEREALQVKRNLKNYLRHINSAEKVPLTVRKVRESI